MIRPFDPGLIDELRAAFEPAADPAAAGAMASYMRGMFPFLGIPSPRRRVLQSEVFQQFGRPDAEQVLCVVERLWELPQREYQYVACDVLQRHARLLSPAHLLRIRPLVTAKSWWDTVDALASHVVGTMVRQSPELSPEMDKWVRDDDLWVVRVAILHQLRFKQATDHERLFRYCAIQAEHRDFFIRKAIGWALREYSKTDPVAVRSFVADHKNELSALSQREALLHLTGRTKRVQGPA